MKYEQASKLSTPCRLTHAPTGTHWILERKALTVEGVVILILRAEVSGKIIARLYSDLTYFTESPQEADK